MILQDLRIRRKAKTQLWGGRAIHTPLLRSPNVTRQRDSYRKRIATKSKAFKENSTPQEATKPFSRSRGLMYLVKSSDLIAKFARDGPGNVKCRVRLTFNREEYRILSRNC